MNVLIADDDRDLAESLGDVLRMRGHTVSIVHDGQAAVGEYFDGVYDIVLMDVRMPRRNGIDALREMIAREPDIKVVIMTAYSEADLLDRAHDLGAQAVLDKPVGVEQILSQLAA